MAGQLAVRSTPPVWRGGSPRARLILPLPLGFVKVQCGGSRLRLGGDSIPRQKLFPEREGLRLIVRLERRAVGDLGCFSGAL
jgi:hypothetical protein